MKFCAALVSTNPKEKAAAQSMLDRLKVLKKQGAPGASVLLNDVLRSCRGVRAGVPAFTSLFQRMRKRPRGLWRRRGWYGAGHGVDGLNELYQEGLAALPSFDDQYQADGFDSIHDAGLAAIHNLAKRRVLF